MTITRILCLLAGILALGAQAALAEGPSFNCAKAGTATEFAICGNAELARLDREIAESYGARRAGLSAQGREALLAEQRAWLAERNSCQGNTDCLGASMRGRLFALSGTSVNPPFGAGAPVGLWQPYSAPNMRFGTMTLLDGLLTFESGTSYQLARLAPGSTIYRLTGRRGPPVLACGPDEALWVSLFEYAPGRLALQEIPAGPVPGEPPSSEILSIKIPEACALGFYTR